MIAIVDYGMGNLGSIRNMLLHLGADSEITSDPDRIAAARKLILPGVGAFDHAMTNLEERGLIPVLNREVLERGKPVLGICLGMQLLSRRSEEGTLPGLGWIDADTIRFRFGPDRTNLKIPHMGWNRVNVRRSGSVMDHLPPEPRFYFVHSYHVRCDREENVLATADYGFEFHAAVIRDHILGTQFHPEKSHKFGLALLKNFAAA